MNIGVGIHARYLPGWHAGEAGVENLACSDQIIDTLHNLVEGSCVVPDVQPKQINVLCF